MQLKISHTTRYRFEQPVHFALQQVRKTPKSTDSQTVLEWNTGIVGGNKEVTFEDHHKNVVELISFDQDITNIEVMSEGLVEIKDTNGIVGSHRGLTPLWLFKNPTQRTKMGPKLRNLVQQVSGDTELEKLHALSTKIKELVTYKIGASNADWTAEDAMREGVGVCQDHAHIFIACARHFGVPARYVSGYLMLNDRTTQDAMHAWAEAYIDNLGWVGFDVSNGIAPDTRYVRVATGLDYPEAAPISGTRQGGIGEVLEVQIDVAQQ